jgi:hypothetical protein
MVRVMVVGERPRVRAMPASEWPEARRKAMRS